MKTSTKIIAAAVSAIALGAGGLAFAQQGEGQMEHWTQGGRMGHGTQMGQMGQMGHGGSKGDMGMQGGGRGGMQGLHGTADVTARLAAVKGELKITAAQEPAWQKFEGAVRQQAGTRQALRNSMQDPKAGAGVDHTAQRDAMAKLRDGNRAQRDAARQALYAVLSPEQKALADQKLGMGQGRRMGMHRHAG